MKLKTAILSAAAISFAASSSFAALTLANGGFEDNGAVTGNADLFLPLGWVAEETATSGGIQNSTNDIGPGSAVNEGVTALQGTGNQYLRLVSDEVGLTGGVYQNLGTADAGTYTITGDYFTGGVEHGNVNYAPVIEFYTGSITGTVIGTAVLADGGLAGNTNNTSNFSVTTGLLAGGENIWFRMRSNATTAKKTRTRGGIDNLQLAYESPPGAYVSIPEPSSAAALLGLAGFALTLRRCR